jgi:hypothetical protein
VERRLAAKMLYLKCVIIQETVSRYRNLVPAGKSSPKISARSLRISSSSPSMRYVTVVAKFLWNSRLWRIFRDEGVDNWTVLCSPLPS